MLKDLQHGFVLLRRDRGVSTLIILVLALGIGGSSTLNIRSKFSAWP